MHTGPVSAKYFNMDIYAVRSLKRDFFSVFSVISHFPHPLVSPLLSLFYEWDLER